MEGDAMSDDPNREALIEGVLEKANSLRKGPRRTITGRMSSSRESFRPHRIPPRKSFGLRQSTRSHAQFEAEGKILTGDFPEDPPGALSNVVHDSIEMEIYTDEFDWAGLEMRILAQMREEGQRPYWEKFPDIEITVEMPSEE
jgi:hypothetical protein